MAVAFNTSNLKPVAKALRQKYPHLQIILAADNDAGTEGNPGVTKAQEAAEAVDGLVAVPRFLNPTANLTDFNDLYRLEGADRVREFVDLAQVSVS